MRSIIILSLFTLLFQTSYSTNPFPALEDSLRKMAARIIEPEHDSPRLELNLELQQFLGEILSREGSINYAFSNIRPISLVQSPDGSFRVFTWYVPLSQGRFEYSGYFQSRTSPTGSEVYFLTDQAEQTEDPMFATMDHENWYGAYYTELIHRREKRKDFYVLLGWRGDNPLTRKRIIEPVKIMGKGRPSFGEPVFRFENNRHKRIIFEYSAQVSMSMRYEEHILPYQRRPEPVIIFDRMVPRQGYFKGNYQFYVPETNIFDGFRFEDGKWIFVPDIDAKNVRRTSPPRRTPPTQ
jgi:hypothetical protein